MTKNSNQLRSFMPALASKSYFNYGGQGPLPNPSLKAITESWEKLQQLGPFTNNVWPYVFKEIDSTKHLLGDMCGVKKRQIALTENVTSGCVLPLLGLPVSRGDHLLISDCEHPGIAWACKEFARQKQLNVDILPLQQLKKGVDKRLDTQKNILKLLEDYLDRKAKIVVLSHVLWNTGQIVPIAAIKNFLSNHPNNPFLVVDGAQSFAQVPIKEAVSNSDIYAFTGHKWACGPEGLGGVALSERVLCEASPVIIGWRSLQNEGNGQNEFKAPLHEDSRRFEVATSCIPLLAGLRCSLNLINQQGGEIERLETIQGLSRFFWTNLKSLIGIEPLLEGPPPAGLVSFFIDQQHSTKDVVQQLGDQHLWLRDLEDPVCLRACFHITTTTEEVSNLVQCIKDLTTHI